MNIDNLVARPALTRHIATGLLENIYTDTPTMEQISDYAEENGLWSAAFLEQFRRRRYSPWTARELEDFLFAEDLVRLQKLNVINFYKEAKASSVYLVRYLLGVYGHYSFEGLIIRYAIGDIANFELPRNITRQQREQLQKLMKYLKNNKGYRQLKWSSWREKNNRKLGT